MKTVIEILESFCKLLDSMDTEEFSKWSGISTGDKKFELVSFFSKEKVRSLMRNIPFYLENFELDQEQQKWAFDWLKEYCLRLDHYPAKVGFRNHLRMEHIRRYGWTWESSSPSNFED